MILMGDMAELS